MDVRDRIETLSRFAQSILTAALAALLLLTLLFEWLSVCGASALSSAVFCLVFSVGSAAHYPLRRLIPARNLLTIIAGVMSVLLIVTAPVCFDFCLRFSAGMGFPQSVVWTFA
ncbi:MAG: hypothetical protein MK102_16345, partial [Fuerstiella sp.]|nr:hypothetical protein [Fuerstiella sp.]